MKVDHVVLNAKTDLDGLEGAFGGFGFRLSSRGFHSLGSINHVAMFSDGYLELIGVPPERPDVRPEVSRGRTGIDGLVLQTADADATADFLRGNGFHPTEVQEFSRPVDLGDTTARARFRTVRLERSPFTAGRVYFCQHLTPELVWREATLGHPNGACRIREIVAVSARSEQQAHLFAALAQGEVEADGDDLSVLFDDFLVRIVSPESYRRTYGDSALALEDTTEFFGAVALGCENRAFLAGIATDDWRCLLTGDGGLRIASQQRRILIDFLDSGDVHDG